MSQKSLKLTIKEKLGYATGDFASNLFWQPFTIFLLYYYTDIFGISAAAIGTMFLVTRVWDTFFDPVMGIVADRTNTRWGKFRPYLLWMALPFGIIGAITYLAPDLSQSGKLIFAYITYTIMMMMYSAINVPYSALLGVISSNPHERESASSFKFTLAFLAGIIVQASTLFMVDRIGRDDSKIVNVHYNDSTITINEVKNGSAKIILSADDNKGGKKDMTFFVKVYKKGLTPPQVVQSLPFDTLQQNFGSKTYDLSKVFQDPDGKKLTFEVKSDNENVAKVQLSGTNLIVKEQGRGIASISVSTSNDVGTAHASFTLAVNEIGNNFPSTSGHISNVEKKQGFKKEIIDLTPIFIDKNNDKLSYFATSSDVQVAGAVITGNELTVNEAGCGRSEIIVFAYDSKGGVASDTFVVKVLENGNAVPTIEHQVGNKELKAGFGKLEIKTSDIFADRDGDKLNLKVTCVNEQKGFFYTMSIFAIIAMFMFFITFTSTKERVKPMVAKNNSLKNDLKDLMKNRPWLILFILSICMQVYVAVRMSSLIYYFKYYVGNTQLAALYLVLGTLASLTGAFFIQYAAKKFGKKFSFVGLIILGTLFTVLSFWVKPEQLFLMFSLQILMQLFTGPLSPLLWAMYTDSADYSEWKTGRRATGLVLSASVFSLKFGWAIGSAITGWLLAYYGFQANIIQNVEAQTGIRMLVTIIPSIGLVLSGVAMIFYKLNEKTLFQIEKDLAERRSSEEK